MKSPLRGLYAITSATLCREPKLLTPAVEAALGGGARLIQYRDKEGDAAQRRATARALLGLCRDHNALFIVNDDVELALSGEFTPSPGTTRHHGRSGAHRSTLATACPAPGRPMSSAISP